jgi:hypothetical protein
LTVTEPPRLRSAGITNGTFQLVLKGGRGFQYDLQTSTNLTDWASVATLAVTNLNGTVLFADAAPPSLSQRFYRAVGTSQ